MANPFVGEIRAVGFSLAPTGWALCNGQLLPLSQNTALFSLLGTFYGGDGKSTFALPDLQAQTPSHAGGGPGLSTRFLGEMAGQAEVTLITSELPSHTHTMRAYSGGATRTSPVGATWASSGTRPFSSAAPDGTMGAAASGVGGGGLPHNNRQPYLVVSFIIAMQGVFPPRS
jgi:microcystin-dependent protein